MCLKTGVVKCLLGSNCQYSFTLTSYTHFIKVPPSNFRNVILYLLSGVRQSVYITCNTLWCYVILTSRATVWTVFKTFYTTYRACCSILKQNALFRYWTDQERNEFQILLFCWSILRCLGPHKLFSGKIHQLKYCVIILQKTKLQS